MLLRIVRLPRRLRQAPQNFEDHWLRFRDLEIARATAEVHAYALGYLAHKPGVEDPFDTSSDVESDSFGVCDDLGPSQHPTC